MMGVYLSTNRARWMLTKTQICTTRWRNEQGWHVAALPSSPRMRPPTLGTGHPSPGATQGRKTQLEGVGRAAGRGFSLGRRHDVGRQRRRGLVSSGRLVRQVPRHGKLRKNGARAGKGGHVDGGVESGVGKVSKSATHVHTRIVPTTLTSAGGVGTQAPDAGRPSQQARK